MNVVVQKIPDNLGMGIGSGMYKRGSDSGLYQLIKRIGHPLDPILLRYLRQCFPIAGAQNQLYATVGTDNRKVSFPTDVAYANYPNFHCNPSPRAGEAYKEVKIGRKCVSAEAFADEVGYVIPFNLHTFAGMIRLLTYTYEEYLASRRFGEPPCSMRCAARITATLPCRSRKSAV